VQQCHPLTCSYIFHRDVQAGASAGGAVAQLARIGSRVGNQVLPRLQRRVCTDDDAKGVASEMDDLGEIVEGIEIGFRHRENLGTGQRR
jgi:hypothetical protein